MRKAVIVFALLAIFLSAAQRVLSQACQSGSCPVACCDDFTTTPYNPELSSLQRWCERWHHVHWNSWLKALVIPRAGDLQTSDCDLR